MFRVPVFRKVVNMLRSLKSLYKNRIQAKDGRIGHVYDFYFDDFFWLVRYLVVDTGNWLPGKKVLVSPVAVKSADWAEQTIEVGLIKQTIKESPDIEWDKPVSRQMEETIASHYRWPMYWSPVGTVTPAMVAVREGERQQQDKEEKEVEKPMEPNLRSMREVTGYSIAVIDGDIGHMNDFIAQDEEWNIRYVVVDTGNWLPGRKVLVAPDWISKVKWGEAHVHVDLEKK